MIRFSVILVLSVVAQRTFADEPEAIVGGTPAAPGEFPYQCSLRLNGYHICGCSIINEVQILTAAHCVYEMSEPYYYLKIVTATLYSNEGNEHGIKIIRVHPDFLSDLKKGLPHDIAVITLEKPIPFNKYQSPIALPTASPVIGSKCDMAGWGRTNFDESQSQKLLKMRAALYNKNICQSVLEVDLQDTHVCAYHRYGIGACIGDSGGPLVCNGQQVGIASSVAPCALGVPDVYTNVFHHLDFIQQAKEDAYRF